MKKIIIAIDGYSSTGKSTIAKQLASELAYVYVDTGAMYRAVTLFGMRKNLVSERYCDASGLIARLDEIQLAFQFNTTTEKSDMFLNGASVEQEIRLMPVSNCVSQVAKIPEVRQLLVKQQRKWGRDKGIVMDGRDIGTVVFPEAELKLFMTASAETRAQRRYDELKENGETVTFEAVLKNIETRDTMDSNRTESPLRKANDAIEIDNSALTRQAQFTYILQLVKERIGASEER